MTATDLPDEATPAVVPARPRRAPPRRTSRLADVAGIAWIVLLAFLFLSPAIKDGPSFGPADLGATLSTLTSAGIHGPIVHNNLNGDIATQDVAWNTLDWHLVHHGELPLWDDLAGNGLPELLNFESAALALPSLVGYLFPLSLAFLVTVAMKLLIAGTGTYVLARLLGCRPLAAAMAGGTFMLSGSFVGWLGWAIGGPLAWSGWVLAGLLLAYRGRRRAAGAALAALSVAFAIYGGFPETYVLMAIGLAVLLGAGGLAALVSRRRLELAGLACAAAGVVGGLALSAPLWLPGVAVVRQSIRAGRVASTGIPLHFSLLLFAQGYDGLPLQSAQAPAGTWFATSFNYNETAAYVGVVALVCAGVAVLTALRRPVVLGLAAAVVVTWFLVYNLGPHAPVQRLITHIHLEGIALQRMLIVLGFLVAVLAGLGLEQCLRRWRDTALQAAFALAVLGVAAVLVLMWAKSSGLGPLSETTAGRPNASPLSATALRRASLYWPSAELALLVLAAAVLPVLARRRVKAPPIAAGDGALRAGPSLPRAHGSARLAGAGRIVALAGAGAVALQSAFLLFAGVGISSYSSRMYPTDAAVTSLQRIAGGSLVGLDGPNGICQPGTVSSCGVRQWTGLGLYPVMNVPYGVDELAVHDPLTPKAYFDSWPVAGAGQEAGGLNVFAPALSSVALAQRYGASYVLVQHETPVPAGMRPVAMIAGPTKDPVTVAAVPGSSRFSFAAGHGRVLSVAHPGDASYELRVRVPAGPPQRLVLRITATPGWHVSLDGQALSVRIVDGTFLSVLVPAGRHEVVASYRPALLEVGFALALLCVLALGLSLAAESGIVRAPLRSFGASRSRRGRHSAPA